MKLAQHGARARSLALLCPWWSAVLQEDGLRQQFRNRLAQVADRRGGRRGGGRRRWPISKCSCGGAPRGTSDRRRSATPLAPCASRPSRARPAPRICVERSNDAGRSSVTPTTYGRSAAFGKSVRSDPRRAVQGRSRLGQRALRCRRCRAAAHPLGTGESRGPSIIVETLE